MISFRFVLCSLGISQYLDYSFSAVQDNCNTEKNTTRILYRWTLKPSKTFVPRGSLFIELLFFNISLRVFLLIQELNHVSVEQIWEIYNYVMHPNLSDAKARTDRQMPYFIKTALSFKKRVKMPNIQKHDTALGGPALTRELNQMASRGTCQSQPSCDSVGLKW